MTRKSFDPEQYLRPDIEELTLTLCLTEECNLACSYCYQGYRRKGAMTFETATGIIDSYLRREDRFKKVIIEFIGGEALLYFDRIRDIFIWTVERIDQWCKPFHFFIDTNGTLLTDEIKKWFEKYSKYISLGLSLDGIPEVHNANRCNSYERVRPHLPFFKSLWPGQPVKMTIGPSTIPHLCDSILHIIDLGFFVTANTPMEDIWGEPDRKLALVKTFGEEIKKVVRWVKEHPEANLPSLVDLPIETITEDNPCHAWCGCGRNMVAFDVDGTPLPCSRFASMSFDHRCFVSPINLHAQSRCHTCAFRPACQTCEANNWEITGNPNVPTNFHCEFIKLQIWGTAQIRLARLQQRLEELRRAQDIGSEKVINEAVLVNLHLKTVHFILEQFQKSNNLAEVGMASEIHYPHLPPRPLWSEEGLLCLRHINNTIGARQ